MEKEGVLGHPPINLFCKISPILGVSHCTSLFFLIKFLSVVFIGIDKFYLENLIFNKRDRKK
jgi:hypothetical protein